MTLSASTPEASTDSFLEIQLFFTSGESTRFVQDDPEIIHALLLHLPSPARLFKQDHLTIAGDRSLSLIPTASVTRLDIRTTSPLPAWPFLGGADSVQDVAETVYRVYQERFDPEQYATSRQIAATVPGTRQSGFTVVEMTGGQRLFWEVELHSRSLMSQDIAHVVTSMLTADGLHARLQSEDPAQAAGMMIINPAHIQCLTFSPGPPQTTPHAWNLRRA